MDKNMDVVSADTPLKAKSAAELLIEQGVALRAAGKTEEALSLYREVAAMPGAPLAAFFNMGNALMALGQSDAAFDAYQKAAAMDPSYQPLWLQLARCEVQRGHVVQAREWFAKTLRADPKNFSAWLEAGHLCRAQGLTDQMLASYREAAESAPDRWEGLLSLARALEDAGQFDSGAAAYHRAIMVAGSQQTSGPDGQRQRDALALRSVHWRMAKFRLERGDTPRALDAIRQALMVQRLLADKLQLDINEQCELQVDLADILMRIGLYDDAHRAFERASVATSEATLVRLAETSFRYNLWIEAQEVLKRNVTLHPTSALAHWNLAHSYAESWQMEDALDELAKAEAIEPQPGAKSMRASVAGRMGDADTALALYRELAEAEGPYSKMRSSAAMSALYSDKLSAQAVADLHNELFAPLGEQARTVSSFKNDRRTDRPLRVGMITADFHHQHPVNIFMQPVLARVNPDLIDLTVYFTGVSYDDQTQLARRRAAHWVEVTSLSDDQLMRRIESDQIDVLLDLAGHTSMQRMSLFGRRAAPVQATFLGYPASTGVPNIDWLIADSVVAPESHASLYSEQLVRLPNTVFCYAPEVDYPYPQYDQSHATRPLTFGSFNNVPKLTPHTIKLWAAVLKEVPGSRLLLKAPSFNDAAAIAVFQHRFAAEGVDADRLEFRGPVGLSDMMAEYADVDIALDPVPYNGGTTTLQAMWMGVPVVVKAGNNFVSRMGASFMQAAGLSDWVAKNDAEYVKIAAAMARDRAALLTLKSGLRSRLLALPGWDIDVYVQDFTKVLQMMWAQFCGAELRATPKVKSKAKGGKARAA